MPRLIDILSLVLLAVLGSGGADISPKPKHVFEPIIVAMATNPAGIYPLGRVWTGMEKITFSDAPPGVGSPNRQFRFDAAQVLGHFRHPIYTYHWAIGERGTNGLNPWTEHAYRPRLPTDAELAAIRNDAAFTNLFGPGIRFPTTLAAGGVSLGSRHFTLGANNTIETLNVYFYKKTPGTNIQGVTIRRGTIRREGVWWYP